MTTIQHGSALLGVWLAASAIAPAVSYCVSLEDGIAALKAGSETMALPRLQEALAILEREARKPDDDGRVHYELARALRGLGIYYSFAGDAAAATRHLTRGVTAAEFAVDRRPGVSEYHTVLGDLYGQLASQSGMMGKIRNGQRAAASYGRAVELDRRNPFAHIGVGITKLETPAMFGGSLDAALAEFRLAQRLDVRCEEAWVWEGIALRRRGDVAGARRSFTHALSINPHNGHARRELTELDEDS